jgi:hypothetical protein
MKIAKKLSTLVLSLIMVLGASSMALAAPNDDVVSALKANHVPQDYIVQAENYLKNHTLTASQSEVVIAQIEKANGIMVAAGTKDYEKLSTSDKNAIIGAIHVAGDAIGLKITIQEQANEHYRYIVKDSSGKIVADFTSSSVKQTGVNNSFIFAGMLLLVLSAGSFIVLKKRAFNA